METKIALSGVPETMLIPMYARALETQKTHPAILDKAAVRMVRQLDYDFSKFDKGRLSMWGCVARTIIFDREIKKYIKKHPNCIGVNLGCGLDTRFGRVDNGKILWYNFDLHPVIDIRRELLPDASREKSIAASILEAGWTDQIPKGEDVFFVFEGILMYFTKEEVQEIFETIRRVFPRAVIFAELSSEAMIKNQKHHDVVNETSAKFRFGVKRSSDIEKICPYLKMQGEWNLTPEMRRFSPLITLMMPFQRFNNRIAMLKVVG